MTESASGGDLHLDVVADARGFRRDLRARVEAAAEGVVARVKVEVDARRLAAQTRAAAKAAQARAKITIKAEVDARRLAAQTRAAARAASARASVKVKAEVDARRLAAQTRAAAREASAKAAAVKVKAEVDARQIAAALRRAVAEARGGASAKVGVSFDTAAIIRDLNRALREAAQAATPPRVRVNVEADTGRLLAQSEAARQAIERRPARIRVSADTSPVTTLYRGLIAAGSALQMLTMPPTVASGLLVAAGAATNLASGLFAVVSAAGQAVGVLGALPGLAAAGIQGLGAVVLGFMGVSKAVQAMTAAEQQSGASAARSARSQVNAAEQIKAARERLAKARTDGAERVARTERDAAERVAAARKQASEQIAAAEKAAAASIESATRDVADAKRAAAKAQEELTEALAEGREELQQLAFQTRDAALAEEQAAINLEHARIRVEQSRQSAVMSPLDRRQAELDYRQALLEMEEAKDRAKDLAAENEKAQQAGVEGTEGVRRARERLADASTDLTDAEKRLSQARQEGAAEVAKARKEGAADIAKTRRDAAEAIRDARRQAAEQVASAQQALRSAQRSARDAAAAAAAPTAAFNNLGHAMDNLSPAGQRFARFVHDRLMPRVKELRFAVQEALLPRVQKGLTAAMPLLDTLQTQFAATGRTVGDLVIRFGKLAGSPAFRRDTTTIMTANNQALKAFGGAGFYLAEALRHVMVVASPLVVRIAKLTERWAKGRAEAAKTGRESGRMAAYFDRAWKTAAKLSHILGELWHGLRNIGKAATPAGNTLLDDMLKGAKAFNAWTARPENQKKLQDFFEQTVPVMRQFADLLGRIGETLGKLAQATGGHTLDGLFAVLNTFLDVINTLADMPAGGTILTTILLLSGAGLGLAIVTRSLGKLIKNLAVLARYTGLSRLFNLLFGRRRGRNQVQLLADDVGKLTDKIDEELPKDKKKTEALGAVGGAAGKTRKPAQGLGNDLLVMGGKAEQSAKKTSRLSRILSGLRGAFGKAGKGIAGLGGMLLAIPGLGGLAKRISTAVSGALAKVKLPSAAKAAGGVAKGGFLAGAVGALLGKFPSLRGVVTRVQTWFGGVLAGIRRAAAKVFTRSAVEGAVKSGAKGAVKGGAKGGAGGPLGIIGGILAGIVGQMIGGGHGGTRGAIGGGITGAATGAAIGGTLGTIVPGIGNALGIGIGAVVGAVIGAITGGKWWGKIGDFFTRTLPAKIVDAAKATPGALKSAMLKGAALTTVLNAWLLDQLTRFLSWGGRKIEDFVVQIPALIIKAMFAPFRLQAKIFAKSPDIFLWVIRQAQRLGGRVLPFVLGLPGKIVRAIKFGFTHIPDLFGWFMRQLKQLPTRITQARAGLDRALRRVISRMMDSASRELVAQMGGLLRDLRHGLSGWTAIFRTATRSALTTVKGWGAAVQRTVSAWMTSARNAIAARLTSIRKTFTSARTSVVGTVKGWGSAVVSTMRGHMNSLYSHITGILNKVKAGFRGARDYVVAAWRPMGRQLAGGVNWIGQNVYNRGIKWAWDKVAHLVGKGGLPAYTPFASGGTWGRVLPGYTPRKDVHRFVSPSGGVLDMSGGEAVMVPEWTRAVGARAVAVWNRLARSGGPAAVLAAMARDFTGLAGVPTVPAGRGYADGGILDGVPHQRFDIGGLWHGVRGFLGDLKDSFYGGLAKSVSKVLDPILNAVAANMGAGSWGQLIKLIPPKMADGFLGWLTKVIEPKLGGDAKGVIAAAKKYIGIGDDAGPNNNRFSRAFGMPGAPWCAMFVSTAIKDAKATKYYPGAPSAAVASFVGAMKHVGLGDGRPGDLAAYRGTGHINLIEKRAPGGYLTIGGNQNALVQRGVRGGQSSILRPKFARGGIVENAYQIFHHEAPRQLDRHEMDTPLVKLMQGLSPAVTRQLVAALMKANAAVVSAKDTLLRDAGGRIPPGRSIIDNLTGSDEWAITPAAVAFLGGPAAVQRLNEQAPRLYAAARAAARPSPAAAAQRSGDGPAPSVNVFPQPRQSEYEIGVVAARKLGAMLQ